MTKCDNSFGNVPQCVDTAALEQKMVKNRAKYPADRYQGWYEKPRG